MEPHTTNAAVSFMHVTKAFGSLVANRDLNFSIQAGSIHGIIGENGAGKSTAMKMLYGMLRPDAGHICINGQAVAFHSAKDARAMGIGMVHQHFMLAGALTAWENLILGQEPTQAWQQYLPLPAALRVIDRRSLKKQIDDIAHKLEVRLDWDTPVSQLPVGTQQKLEVMKLLLGKARILILDEPTAVLTPQEAQDLFRILRALRDTGHTIVIITHKLKEVKAITDRVTVMRQGSVVAERATTDTDVEELGSLMVGRSMRFGDDAHTRVTVNEHRTVLSLEQITMAPHRGKKRLDHINLTIDSGEIVGIAGVQGSGQRALLDLIAEPKRYFRPHRRFHEGVKLLASGQFHLNGQDASAYDNASMRRAGMGFIAEDRHGESLLLETTLCDNFLLGHQDASAFIRHGLVTNQSLEAAVTNTIRDYDLRPPLPRAIMRSLSGGNQQKLVMGRELWAKPRLLVAAEPTRGVDIHASSLIHQKIREARNRGAGVLLISSDLDELMNLADKILVMCDGHIIRCFTRQEFSEAAIGIAMGGGHDA